METPAGRSEFVEYFGDQRAQARAHAAPRIPAPTGPRGFRVRGFALAVAVLGLLLWARLLLLTGHPRIAIADPERSEATPSSFGAGGAPRHAEHTEAAHAKAQHAHAPSAAVLPAGDFVPASR
ncbi:hypothetical protein BH11PLA1_BH11PLA1_06440 [soil metagenome]